MNAFQAVWYEQVRADNQVLRLLRKVDAAPCHQLHYLQMIAEKLGKAYFWRAGKPPTKSHAFFVQFLKALNDRPDAERLRIARTFGFATASALQSWISAIGPLAYEVESLAPNLAGDGPNPEYPWPWTAPAYAPSTYEFDVVPVK